MNILMLSAALVLGSLAFAQAQPQTATTSAPKKAPAVFQIPEIPDQYDLPGGAARGEGASVPTTANFDDLRNTILSAGPDRLKADAAVRWNERFNNTHESAEYWKAADQSFDLLDELFKQEPSKYRRYAIFQIFAGVGSSIRDYVLIHPEDPQWRAHWRRAGDIKRQGLADKDPRLAEFFQRYVPQPNPPDWKTYKRQTKKIEDQLAAAKPALKTDLDRIWKLSESVEANQEKVAERIKASIRKMKLDADHRDRLIRYLDHVYAYRMYTNWANLHTRAVAERVGPEIAAAAGIRVEPVKLGWPSY